MKVKVQRRSAQDLPLQSFLIGAVNQDTLCVPGYTRLVDSPDVQAAVGGLADIVSNATIQLMQNTSDGDVRVRNALSRFMDISPWAHGTRKDLIAWIVWTMLTSSCGSAFLLPHTTHGLLSELEPMPDAVAMSDDNGQSYYVMWRGQRYDSSTVLHFKRYPDPMQPWRGLGLRVSLHDLANSLRQTSATKKGFMSDKWKPSVIVKVDALSDEFADEAGRQRLIDQYLSNSSVGAPWIIPSDMMEVQQVKPLSLTDLAIRDSVELDKRAVASLVGVFYDVHAAAIQLQPQGAGRGCRGALHPRADGRKRNARLARAESPRWAERTGDLGKLHPARLDRRSKQINARR